MNNLPENNSNAVSSSKEEIPTYSNEPPIRIDIERMKKALVGPSILIPSGLTSQEIVGFITKHASTPPPLDYDGPDLSEETAQKLREKNAPKDDSKTIWL